MNSLAPTRTTLCTELDSTKRRDESLNLP